MILVATRTMESPRLAAFVRACSAGGTARVDHEWSMLSQGGLPLVERLPGVRDALGVTFVWRPNRHVDAPSISTPVADVARKETELRPAGHTGVWFRTLVLPRRTRAFYAFSPLPVPGPDADGSKWAHYFRNLTADPLNPSQLTMTKGPDSPVDDTRTFSVVELPGAPPQPWSRIRGPSKWTGTQCRMRSRFLRGSRSVWVYVPPVFQPGRRGYNLIVVLDGAMYLTAVPAPRIVENLVDSRKLGPSVVVLVGNGLHARTEELARNPRFVMFLSRELIPWLRRRFRLSTKSSKTVLAGSSLGGLTAAYAALQCPRLFGKVLAQSGAFLWPPPGATAGSPTLMEEFARAPRNSTEFYLDAGTFEGTVLPGMPMSLLSGVRYLRDVLMAKGYSVKYAEFEGGHDYACWRGTFADGLVQLLGNRSAAS